MHHRKTRSGYTIYRALSRQTDAFAVFCGKHRVMVDTGAASACRKQKANPHSLSISEKEASFLFHPHRHFDPSRTKKNQKECNYLVIVPVKELVEQGYARLPG